MLSPALDVLEPEEAVALLARVAGAERVRAERGAALDIVAACGFLPLTVRAVGARLAAGPGLGLGWYARRLVRGGLDELRAAGLRFHPGEELLGREEARAFRLLAPIDAMAFSTGDAAVALGVDRHRADELVESLTDHGLLETLAPGLYRFHELTRQFALSRGRTFREDATGRADRRRHTRPHRAAAR